jgi:hypothetical protein
MNIFNPKTALDFAAKKDDELVDGLHYWFAMLRDSNALLIEHINAQPSVRQLGAAASYLEEITDLAWTTSQVTMLISLYPRARITLAGGGDAHEQLAFAVAHFFLNTSWPTYGDNVDVSAFVRLLQRQAMLMGFRKTA